VLRECDASIEQEICQRRPVGYGFKSLTGRTSTLPSRAGGILAAS
jgi:hypothetical protein